METPKTTFQKNALTKANSLLKYYGTQAKATYAVKLVLEAINNIEGQHSSIYDEMEYWELVDKYINKR